jgi:hypothetical protein
MLYLAHPDQFLPLCFLDVPCLQCPRDVQLAAAGALSIAARELPANVGQVLDHVVAAYEVSK